MVKLDCVKDIIWYGVYSHRRANVWNVTQDQMWDQVQQKVEFKVNKQLRFKVVNILWRIRELRHKL